MSTNAMNRRVFLKSSLATAAAASLGPAARWAGALAAPAGGPAAGAPPAGSLVGSRPNIILILTDDQGYGEIAAHGNTIIQTPNLDRLRGQSIRFEEFHVSPTCAPTRCSIMTGRQEFRSGVTHTILERERMSLKATPLPQLLKAAGYATGIFGKWHLGDEDAYQPGRRGFDEVYIHGCGGIGQTFGGSCGDAPRNSYFGPYVRHNGTFVKTDAFCTDVFFGQATTWIDQQRQAGKPFFAYITPNAPHAPYQCPEKYLKLYEGKGLDKNAAAYYGMITNIDENVGRLMDRLKEWGLDEKTLLIFMTDNGHSMAPLFNAGMRGAKGSPWRGGTRTAAFWRWTGKFRPGQEIDKLTAHVDILPTFVELAGAKLPGAKDGDKASGEKVPGEKLPEAKLDGRSLLPLLSDPAAKWDERILVTHVGRWGRGQAEQAKYRNCSVFNSRFRLVENKQLFDYRTDPGEKTDVAAEHPDVVAKLRAAYDQWWSEVLPCLENESVTGPPVNPWKEAFWKQYGGGPASQPASRPAGADRKGKKKKDA